MPPLTPREIITRALEAAFPEGLTAEDIRERCPNMEPKQRSNALYNMKQDCLIERDEHGHYYLVQTPSTASQPPPAPAPMPVPPPKPDGEPAGTADILPLKKKPQNTRPPTTAITIDRQAVMAQLGRIKQQMQPRTVDNLDVKLELLHQLVEIYRDDIAAVCSSMIDDYEQTMT